MSTNACLLSLVAVLSIFSSNSMAVFPVTFPDPIALNSNAVGDSGSDNIPRIVTDGKGHWVAIWDSNDTLGGTIGNDNDILCARSENNGQSWTPPTPVNINAASDGSGSDSHPIIATDSLGTWIVVWNSTTNLGGVIGTDLDILYARSTNNGVSWSLPAPLNTNASIDNVHDIAPQISTDSMGHWVAVWSAQINPTGPGSDYDMFVATSNNAGATWTPPVPLNTNATTDSGHDGDAVMGNDGQGNWLVAWQSNENLGGAIGADTDFFFARSTDNGASWTPPAVLNTNAATDTDGGGDLTIAADGHGVWLVAWTSTENLGGVLGTDGDIQFARSTDNGATWSDPMPLNNNAAGDLGADEIPSLYTDGNGNWIATWDSNNAAGGMVGSEYDVFIAHSADSGMTWTDPVQLNAYANTDTRDDYFAIVSSDKQGNWIAAWESSENVGGSIGNDYDILTLRFAFPDCNSNGIGDLQEIAENTTPDCNANGIPDACETDSDGDGIIDACASVIPPPGTQLLPVCGTCAPGVAMVMAAVSLMLACVSRGRRNCRPSRIRIEVPALAVLLLMSAELKAQFPANLGAAAPLNANATTDAPADVDYNARAATDGNGHWIALWTYDVQPSMNSVGDIMVARSSDNGATWTAPAILNNNGGAGSPYDDEAQITTDGNGNWVAIWQSFGFLGADSDIVVSRSTDNGATWTPVAPLNTNAGSDTGNDEYPHVTTDGQGHWVAVWSSTENLGGTINTDSDILVARSTDNGATWTPPAPLNSNAAIDGSNATDEDVHIATDGQGHWLAVWSATKSAGNDNDILFARSNDNGATWTPPTPLNNNAATDTRSDIDSQVITDGNGNWLVAWLSVNDLGGTGTDGDIVVARSTDNGSSWTDPAPLNTNATTDSGLDEAVFVETDRHGNWVAAWRSQSDIGGNIANANDFDLLIAHSADNGQTWTSPALLNAKSATDTTPAEFEPRIVTDGLGNWIAVWDSNDNQDGAVGTDGDIVTLRFAFPDCNANGIGDGQDIAEATSPDCNANGIPDECETDSDGDGIIDACASVIPPPGTQLLPFCGTCAPGVPLMLGICSFMLVRARIARRSLRRQATCPRANLFRLKPAKTRPS